MDNDNDEEDLRFNSDKSDSELLNECEIVLEDLNDSIETRKKNLRKSVEKRKEREDDSSVEEYTTVTRKSKRLIRSNSNNAENNHVTQKNNLRVEEKQNNYATNVEVCVSSVDALPKQMAFAKLLSNESIKNILRIKYKSPYKVLIRFATNEDAENLINCRKFKELGFKCYMTYESTMSFGIIKGVDMELKEEEIMDILESESKILSIKRLKRISLNEIWVDSETVRLCFEGSTLPSYVYAYGCRFKVNPFVFPVTQCTGCWKFGHYLKYCPTKIKICPKCGGQHENCEIKDYVCLNCKGPHLVLDKQCPLHIKEKNIRAIMAKENSTYRKALEIYNSVQNKNINIQEPIDTNLQEFNQTLTRMTSSALSNSPELYSSIVTKNGTKRSTEDKLAYSNYKNGRDIGPSQKKKTKEKPLFMEEIPTTIQENRADTNGRDTNCNKLVDKYKFDFKKFILKLKNIIMSERSLEEKIVTCIKLLYDDIKKCICSLFDNVNLIQYFLSIING
ncbi:uncharacterized protein LOC111351629 [Spodoptera litura]|uniref:Uncharacterized protein LOC111351629 n=1 Tax=Spodoptera litura TaxID=69820 RepID=A0A9J7DZ07_SPOLT|nr:uncharacterized protein LOC111351629 [Spodoptera litura]